MKRMRRIESPRVAQLLFLLCWFAYFTSYIGRRAVFGAAAICLGVMAVIWIIGFEKIEKCGKDPEEDVADVDNDESTAANTVNAGQQAWLGSGILMVLFPVIIHGMLKDGVTTWVPTYITETFLTSPAFSILVTTVLPIVNLTGAYLAQYLYQKCKKQEAAAAIWLFLIAVLALTGIWIGKDTSMILTIVLFAMTTASMMGVNTIFVNFFPLRYETIGKVSTVSGYLYDRGPGRTERLECDDRKLGSDDVPGAGSLYAGEKEIFVTDIWKKLKTGDIVETLTGEKLVRVLYCAFSGSVCLKRKVCRYIRKKEKHR